MRRPGPKACSTRWSIERPYDALSAPTRHDLSAPLALDWLNTRSRASRLVKRGSCANHFRRRRPLELQRGMQRPSGSTLRHPICTFNLSRPGLSLLHLCVLAARYLRYFLYRFTLKSACALWPAKFSISQSLEQYSPISALASGVHLW